MTYLASLHIDLLIKCVTDNFSVQDIIQNYEIFNGMTLFNNKHVWKALWKRDISTFNIPECITYELYVNTYKRYGNIGMIEFEKVDYVIKHNCDKLVDLLIKDPKQYQFNIDTMIFGLHRSNNIEFIQCIMDKMKPFKYHNRILQGACMDSQREVIKWIVENYNEHLDYNEALEFAVRGQNTNIIQMILDLGVTKYKYGLYEACENSDHKNFEWMISLIESHYKQEEKIKTYNHALYYAANSGEITMVKKLINLGATDYDDSCQVCGIPKNKIMKLILDKRNGININ